MLITSKVNVTIAQNSKRIPATVNKSNITSKTTGKHVLTIMIDPTADIDTSVDACLIYR